MPGEVGRPGQPSGGAPGESADRLPHQTLDRAPGQRYRDPTEDAPLARPDLLRGLLFGLLASLGTAAAWGILSSILEVELGLIVVAIIGGWVIGGAVGWGVWSGLDHAHSGAAHAMAGFLGGLSWLGGSYLAYLLALLLRPGSDLTFPQRIVAQPFFDWLAPQVSALDFLSVAVLVVLAWRSAR